MTHAGTRHAGQGGGTFRSRGPPLRFHRRALSEQHQRSAPGGHPARANGGRPVADVGAPPTASEIRVALLRAYRALAPSTARVGVGVAVERVRRLPRRPGRPGRDVPAARAGVPVYPARVRYAVERAAPPAVPGGHAAAPVVVEATFRFWRAGAGAWAFTGRLDVGAVGGGTPLA